jgi:acylphosphatase
MEMLLLTAIVSGRVQHVGYRSRVVTMARTLDLKGYVKNLADGRVLVVAQGERPDLERFCRAIRMEDPLIKVEDIQVQLSEPKGDWDEFYRISGDRETDSRLDSATVFLKELIVVVKGGFKETNSRLGSMESKLDRLDGKLDKIASEVKGLRMDLTDCALSRLSKMHLKPS